MLPPAGAKLWLLPYNDFSGNLITLNTLLSLSLRKKCSLVTFMGRQAKILQWQEPAKPDTLFRKLHVHIHLAAFISDHSHHSMGNKYTCSVDNSFANWECQRIFWFSWLLHFHLQVQSFFLTFMSLFCCSLLDEWIYMKLQLWANSYLFSLINQLLYVHKTQ